ncbi:MAG: hypothetical protein IT379_21800 [Deltaproteobacteria bacterium]|nr:hypothetical protein [Deltaproteobacteria bacterium]
MIQGRWRPIVALGTSVLSLGLFGTVVACTDDDVGRGEGHIGVRTEWLGAPSDVLPPGVASVRVVLKVDGSPDTDLVRSVTKLEDMDDNSRPELVVPALPLFKPIRLEIEGRTMDDQVRWYGSAGPIVLSAGERRYVDLRMYELNAPVAIDPSRVPARFAHTATALADGRLLVAGGFTTVAPGVCPLTAPTGTVCHDLTATREALLFDPTSGRTGAVRTPMLEARGGHTATLLPDGRVLVAGGAPRARLELVPLPAGRAGYVPSIVPLLDDGRELGRATFEIFDPAAGREQEDVDADGDPFVGAFAGGAASPSTPGVLQVARAFHGAASVGGGDTRVILAGGVGAAAGTLEVFDGRRPGGEGVYPTIQSLSPPRTLPAVLSMQAAAGREVWIVGGVLEPRNNADLAAVWRPNVTPEGLVGPTGGLPFPNYAFGDLTPRPEHSLIAPAATVFDQDRRAIVVGWFGPRCATGSTTPTFMAPDEDTLSLCDPAPAGSAPRSFAIDATLGAASPLAGDVARSFAAAATLANGRPIVTGGVVNLVFSGLGSLDLYEPSAVTPGSAAPGRLPPPFVLTTLRSFHTSTALPNGTLVTLGGMTIVGSAVTLVAGGEIVLAR